MAEEPKELRVGVFPFNNRTIPIIEGGRLILIGDNKVLRKKKTTGNLESPLKKKRDTSSEQQILNGLNIL